MLHSTYWLAYIQSSPTEAVKFSLRSGFVLCIVHGETYQTSLFSHSNIVQDKNTQRSLMFVDLQMVVCERVL